MSTDERIDYVKWLNGYAEELDVSDEQAAAKEGFRQLRVMATNLRAVATQLSALRAVTNGCCAIIGVALMCSEHHIDDDCVRIHLCDSCADKRDKILYALIYQPPTQATENT